MTHLLIQNKLSPLLFLNMQNWNASKLCSGTRLRILSLNKNGIETNIFTGSGVNIRYTKKPKITNKYPFEFMLYNFCFNFVSPLRSTRHKDKPWKLRELILQIFPYLWSIYIVCSRESSEKNLHSYVYAPEQKTNNIVYKVILKSQ